MTETFLTAEGADFPCYGTSRSVFADVFPDSSSASSHKFSSEVDLWDGLSLAHCPDLENSMLRDLYQRLNSLSCHWVLPLRISLTQAWKSATQGVTGNIWVLGAIGRTLSVIVSPWRGGTDIPAFVFFASQALCVDGVSPSQFILAHATPP